jgi:LPS-assembly lipoprotein
MWSREIKSGLTERHSAHAVSSTRVIGARAAVIAVAMATAAMLGACGNANSGGFSPLYGPTASGAHLNEKFATVDFATIPGRVGQRIRNELLFDKSATTPTGAAAAHRLEVKVIDNVATTLVKINGDSQGQVYQVEASYRLVDLKTNKPVFEGRSLARAGFERFESIYSNVRAREDAENRAAENIASDIRTRLAAYLSQAN